MSQFGSFDISRMARRVLEIAGKAQTEADLQVEVEHHLRNFFEKVGVSYEPHHNVTIVKGRPDTLYGRVLVEYKVPGTLKSPAKFNAAVAEVQGHINETAGKTREDSSKYIGVVLDGFQLSFTKFRKGAWITEGVQNVDAASIQRLLEYLRGLARKPLHPDLMVKDFGPDGPLAKESVKILYGELVKSRTPRVRALFEEWQKTFCQVCGYDFKSPRVDVKELVTAYEIRGKKVDIAELLFVIHTYFAIVIKFLAAEITVTYASPLFRSFLDEVMALSSTKMRDKVMELEEGGLFSDLGIKNFLEGDFFGWYNDVWNDAIHGMISKITSRLAEYEPATATLEPDQVRDLLKKLYQYLVPRKIRHDLGEFFTPDWLADLVLEEAGYTGDPEKRALDPACGSGTFPALLIKRVREFAQDKVLDKSDILPKILKNIIGFDLNPLAVIAARTNYLIALGDLLRYRKGDVHIPIYLCDSISVMGEETLEGKRYDVSTSVGKFSVPASVVREELIDEVFSVADECVKGHCTSSNFVARVREAFPEIEVAALQMLRKLYDELLALERKGINRIWTRVIKNSFAPFFSGKFHFVVGNPPWVTWESLPEEYRESTKGLWQKYDLIKGQSTGKFKKDIAMLFVAISVARYLTDDGRLSLLVPFTLFKTQAGAGFRTFLAWKCEVLGIHDLVELKPFEGAINRTSLLTLKKGRTTYPIKCVTWRPMKSVGFDFTLEQARSATKQIELAAVPIESSSKPGSPWLFLKPEITKALHRFIAASAYEAQEGINTRGANGIFWVRLKQDAGSSLVVENMPEMGRQKDGSFPHIAHAVERDAVYPLLRGEDVKRWIARPSSNILVPCDPKTGRTLPDNSLRTSRPKLYSYLNKFRGELSSRRMYGKSIRGDFPFFNLFQVNEKTFAKYKVVWKEIAGEISGKGVFSAAVVSPTEIERRIVIPDHKLMFIPFADDHEAYYVAAILNSSPTRLIVAGYTIETAISTHIVKYVRVMPYDRGNPTHEKLSTLSREAHELATKGDPKLVDVENQIDESVAELYGLSRDEMKTIKETLEILQS